MSAPKRASGSKLSCAGRMAMQRPGSVQMLLLQFSFRKDEEAAPTIKAKLTIFIDGERGRLGSG